LIFRFRIPHSEFSIPHLEGALRNLKVTMPAITSLEDLKAAQKEGNMDLGSGLEIS
jgi:hypothetical protein